MSRRRRRQLLVPEARAALDQLRDIVITQQTTNAAAQPQAPGTPANSNYQNTTGAAGSSAIGTPQTGVQSVANQLGIPYQQQNNGELTTRQAGKIGGAIGGSMIQRLISIAEQELVKEQAGNPRRP